MNICTIPEAKFAKTYNEESRVLFPLIQNDFSEPFDNQLRELIA